MLHQTVRVLAFGLGALLFLGGLVALSAGGEAMIAGVEAIVMAAVLMVASLIQRSGYRSEFAERHNKAPGPGGGEDGPLEHRFVPTTETFLDPTSHRLMRVYEDPRTSERRYRAER
jgi:hypothetical protein